MTYSHRYIDNGEGRCIVCGHAFFSAAQSSHIGDDARKILQALLDEAGDGGIVLLHRDGKTYRFAEVGRVIEIEL